MADIERLGISVEAGLELGPIVCLQHANPEWQPFSNLVEELDRRAPVAPVIDL